MKLQLHTPSAAFDDGEFKVYLNTGSSQGRFGVIDFGPGTYMYADPADAERMIRALAKVIAFDRAYQELHAFEDAVDTTRCARCGTPRVEPVHAEPDPPGCICDVASADQCPVHRSEPAAEPELTVRERAQRGARKAAEREAAGEGEPAICGSEREVTGSLLYQCELRLGHKGMHAVLTPTGACIAEWTNDLAYGVHTPSGYQPASVSA